MRLYRRSYIKYLRQFKNMKTSTLKNRYQKSKQRRYHEMILHHGYAFCESCLRPESPEVILSGSHLISRQDCLNYGLYELYYDIENIRFHCLDWGGRKGCHSNWENGTKPGQDFQKNIEKIKIWLSDEKYYPLLNKYLSRWEQFM